MCAGRSNVALCRTAGNAAEAYGREALRSGASKRFAFGFNADSRRSRRSGLRRGWPPLCRQSVGKALNNRFPISVLRRTWIALCVEELVDAESSEMNVAIVTISDSSFQDASLDRSGPLMRELLEKSEKLGVTVSNVLIIPDEKELISKTLVDLCNLAVQVVLTSGGTGFAPRDVTPEATNSVIERACPGIVAALLNKGLQATPFAALTRLAAGIRGSTLIVNMPGNPKAVKECFEVLELILTHAVQLINDNRDRVVETHKNLA